jgi:predicted MFS family arabinose efflux permease
MDYLGAVLLSVAVVATLLIAVWGGVTYPWGSPAILTLGAVAAVSAIAFIICERRAGEPILPLALFRNSIFAVSTTISFVSGVAMFAALVYLPEYQQVVRGYSATKSGLLMLPLVIGLLIASISSGRIISKTGKYRFFPIIGTILTGYGLWLLSHIDVATSQVTLSVWMFITGFGIGLFMQVLTLAVQNAVDPRDLGTATASVSFFRSIGSTLGTAGLGALLANRLQEYLGVLLPGAGGAVDVSGGSATIAKLDPAVAARVLEAFSAAFRDLFFWTVPFAAVALVISLFLKERPLRARGEEYAAGQGFE